MKSRKLAASLWIHLAKCASGILKEVRRVPAESDLTLPQFDVLAQVARYRNGLSAGAISSALLVSAGNITGILVRLQERRLIIRRPDPRDRRFAVVKLTPAGRRVATAEVARHERCLDRVLGVVSQREQKLLRDSLERLWKALERRKV